MFNPLVMVGTGETRAAAEGEEWVVLAESQEEGRPALENVIYAKIPDPSRATPDHLFLGTLSDPRLRLRTPLLLEVLREGEQVGVWSDELEQLGTGPHLTAALADMQGTLAEAFFAFEADAREDRLAPHLRQMWDALANYVERKD